jgi:hypothetical protein
MAYYSGEFDKNTAFKLSVTKLDAAHAQITSAILLYFKWGDPVAMHTLASAAYSILQDINRDRGGDPMTQDFTFITDPKTKTEVLRVFREPQNFFKHADKDPESILVFLPYSSAYMLFEAIGTFEKLAKGKISFFEIYNAWFILWGFGGEGDPFPFPDTYRKFIEGLRAKYTPKDRKKYFDEEFIRRFGDASLEKIIGGLVTRIV